jgi:hypothetical protein
MRRIHFPVAPALIVAGLLSSDVLGLDPPLNASLVGHWDGFDGEYGDVWAEGDYAYLGHYALGDGKLAQIQIVNIADPANPYLETTYFLPSPNEYASPEDVHVADGLLFIGLYSNPFDQVAIVDVREPAAPNLVATVNIPTSALGAHTLTYDNGYLYFALITDEVYVVDLTTLDPDNPPPGPITEAKWVIEGVGDSFVHEVTASNGRLYCAAWNSGLWVYDISDLANQPPAYLGDIDGSATHTAWPTEDGEYVVTAEERDHGPLKVYRVNDNGSSISFTLTDIHLPPEEAFCVHQPIIINNRVYLASYEAGLEVLQLEPQTGSLCLLASFPTLGRIRILGMIKYW